MLVSEERGKCLVCADYQLCKATEKPLREGVVQIVRNRKVRGGGQHTWDSTKEQNIHATAQKTPQSMLRKEKGGN